MSKKYIELNNQVLRPDGSVDLQADQAALQCYFQEEVNERTQFFHTLDEKVRYMVDNGYWDKAVIDRYSLEDIKSLMRQAYGIKFRFASFMGAESFYSRYATKKRDGSVWLERYEDRMTITAMALAEGDITLARNMVEHMVRQRFVPATPTLMNAGKANTGRLVSCFLLESCTDNLNSIMRTLGFAAELSKGGGGIGVNFSNLRAAGESLRGLEGVTKGVVPVAKMLDQAIRYADQAGQRKGAAVGYLSVMHADFLDFLSAKKIASDDDVRLKTLSIGAVLPDIFMDKVFSGEDFYQFYPHSIKKVTGQDFTDIDWSRDYQSLVDNPSIRKKKVSARKILEMIAVTQGESGYPYILFEGNANKVNPVSNVGTIKMSNLCSEILQPTTPSTFGGYGEEDQIGLDVSCNLASIVINDDTLAHLGDVVASAIRTLDSVARQTDIKEVPAVQRANREMRSIGLGAMGLHSFLAQKGVVYGSPEAIEFVNILFESIHYHARRESMFIAREQGYSFTGFEGSEYQNGKYFEHYLTDSEMTQAKVSAIDLMGEGTAYIPDAGDWRDLIEKIKQNGLAHSHVMAIAPTGSISYVASATQSIMPITEKVEVRTSGRGKTVYPMPFLNDETEWFYEEAYSMDMTRVIDTVAAAQKHVDQGISFTLFFGGDVNTADMQYKYLEAYKKGIKTLYYTRLSKEISVEECETCQV